MHVPEVVKELSRLVALEVDAVHAYEAAIPTFGLHTPIGQELQIFKLEHQRHAIDLHATIADFGYSPPEVVPDVKGVVIGALTAPARPLEPEEVLVAMRGNEQLTGSVWAKALAKPFPASLRAMLERAREDERHHLEWIERTLSKRLWEQQGAGSAAHAP
jgi:hypothetical protein